MDNKPHWTLVILRHLETVLVILLTYNSFVIADNLSKLIGG